MRIEPAVALPPIQSVGAAPRERALAIVRAVAAAHGVAFADVMAPRCGPRPVSAARRAAMIAVAAACGWNSCHLGRLFRRDHTTVLYAIDEGYRARKTVRDRAAP